MREEKNNLILKCNMQEGDEKGDISEFTDITGNGRWQFWIFVIITLSQIPTAWNHLGGTFLAFPKEYKCVQPCLPNRIANPKTCILMSNSTRGKKLNHCNECEIFLRNYSENGTAFTTTMPCASWTYEAGYKSIIEEWDLVCSDNWLISASQSIYMLGFLVVALLSGQMSDRYGRHPTIIFTIAIAIVAGLATAFSTSYWIFVACRFFVAMGNSGSNLVMFVLLLEVVGPKYRAKICILSSFGWSIGYLLLPLMAWEMQNWFYLQLAITIPCFLYIFLYWLLPESPRWLLSTDKLKKATAVIEKATRANRRHVSDIPGKVQTLYSQQFKKKECQENATVVDLLKTPNLRRKTLSLYFIWLTIAFTYYGLSLNTSDLQGDIYWNFFFLGLVEIPATFFCIFTVDRYGRKKPFICTLMFAGVACLGCIFMKNEWWQITTSLAMFGKFFTSASFSIVYLYSAEIFPTVARNVGVGSCSTIARVGSSIAPFMSDLGKITHPSVPLGLFGVFSVISGILVIFLPETVDYPVPETLNQAEEFGKSYDISSEKLEMDSDLKPLMVEN